MKEVVPLIGSKEGISHLALAYLEPGDVAHHSRAGLQRVSGRHAARRAASRTATRCVRARTSSSISTRFPATCCVARAFSISTIRTIRRPPIAPRDYLERVVQRCREHDILLVYDNAYSELAFDGYVPPSIFEIDGARDVAIEFHSLSKTYNMTGWRCGWAVGVAGDRGRAREGEVVHRHGAVHGGAGGRRRRARELRRVRPRERRRSSRSVAMRPCTRSAKRASRARCRGRRCTSGSRCPRACRARCSPSGCSSEEGVVVMPGSAFGAGGEGFFRISFITSPERIAEAAQRAGRVLNGLLATAEVNRREDSRAPHRRVATRLHRRSTSWWARCSSPFCRFRNPIRQWLMFERGQKPKAEQVTYVATPSAASAVGAQRRRQRARARQAAHRRRSSRRRRFRPTVPPAPRERRGDHRARDRSWAARRTGSRRASTPSYGDPRVVGARQARSTHAPKTQARARRQRDLIARVRAQRLDGGSYNGGKKPGDWTFEKNGEKYGMDSAEHLSRQVRAADGAARRAAAQRPGKSRALSERSHEGEPASARSTCTRSARWTTTSSRSP